MKKKLLLLLLLLFPLSANAEEGQVLVNCPEEVKANEEFVCEITGYSPYEVNGIDYRFELPNGIEKVNFEVDPIWEGYEEDNILLIYTDTNKIGNFNIGKITLKSVSDLDEISLSTTKLQFSDETFETHDIVVEDVNNVENNTENEEVKNNNFILYVIIVLVIIIAIAIMIVIIKMVVKKNRIGG